MDIPYATAGKKERDFEEKKIHRYFFILVMFDDDHNFQNPNRRVYAGALVS